MTRWPVSPWRHEPREGFGLEPPFGPESLPVAFRVPGVAIVRGAKPNVPVIVTPPDTVVEILSPDDRASDIQDKIDDYLAFGIPGVWVIRPETRRAWTHTIDGSREVKDGVLRNVAGDLQVPLAAIFE